MNCVVMIFIYSGAISAGDLMLYIGAVQADTVLEIQLEFLVKFTLPSSLLQHSFSTKLATHCLKYTATLATSLPVESVTPLHQVPDHLGDFHWDFIAGPRVVHIQYQYESSEPLSMSGFSLQLANGLPSGCCSLTYPTASEVDASSAYHPGTTLGCDGVMMLNSPLTIEQFPTKVQNKKLHPSEFVFAIDCSGSMGSNIQAATDTLVTCIKSVPYGSYFNVIAFGSKFKFSFLTSQEYNKKSMNKGIQFANQLRASLGGLELLDPLQWIFKQPTCGSLARQVFIVTDGGVNNTQRVLRTVIKNRLAAR